MPEDLGTERPQQLEDRLALLERRLAALESAGRPQRELAPSNTSDTPSEDELAEVLLQVEVRRSEVEASFDLAKDDPATVESLYVEFDEWSDRVLREGLGPDLYTRVHAGD